VTKRLVVHDLDQCPNTGVLDLRTPFQAGIQN
jgi:hypothetical protein